MLTLSQLGYPRMTLMPKLQVSYRMFSTSGSEDDSAAADQSQAAQGKWKDPDIPPEEFQKMQESLRKFAQCMGLGKYSAAQMILNEHREDIQRWFGPNHPANLSVDNNQALLLKLDGNYEEARRMFERVVEKYTLFYGEHHQSTVNALINLATVMKDLK